ncbi:BCD family MFS transporter [Spirulina sp. 06S082]|uniref:BCD family MFS transporter n=1 Tax=Spirulina sp. 06S082 TaxID=3110248 RepID=UPI002B1FC03D|nr:BCD family MFS transporter [Spirulina sp. 06S082]MEA5468708.1 BCD family MFS transporter [Spirulina sp. 06S082]
MITTDDLLKPEIPPKPQIELPTIFRLGLFNLGLGMMSVLTVAVLNRVMISELGIPGGVTAGVIAAPYFIAPARVWFGQLSDAKPLFGTHRTGYVLTGTAVFGVMVFAAVQVVWQLARVMETTGGWVWNQQTTLLTILLAGIFALYGLAVSASSTPFTAMLVDISEEDNRSKIVAIVWSMLMVGIVIGGISGKVFLKNIDQVGTLTPLEALQGPINTLFLIVPCIVWGLAAIATWGVEKRYSLYASRSSFNERSDGMTLGKALKVLTSSRQTGFFFSFLLVMTIGLFLQEAVLEPYGGEVFGMSIGETTALNSFWGMGILLGYGTTGFLVVPRLGKKNTTKLGCLLVAICFLIIISAGFTQNPLALKSAMFVFGIAAGFATIGAISLMLDLTAAETAGTFIGVWGLAQALARAIAIWSGGSILDLGRFLFKAPLLAYSSVFVLQALGMLLAIAILDRVDVQEFQSTSKQAIATIMESELDG